MGCERRAVHPFVERRSRFVAPVDKWYDATAVHRGVAGACSTTASIIWTAYSGHIDHFREFEAEDNSAAIDMAAGWASGEAMELWNRHRKLKHWDEPLAAPINDSKTIA